MTAIELRHLEALAALARLSLRRLEDGREFRIIKRSLDPDRLGRDLREHDLDASFVETGEFFVYGLGRRA